MSGGRNGRFRYRNQGGWAAYWMYRAVTIGMTPLIHHLFLRWRKYRGLEHPVRWKERLGYPSSDYRSFPRHQDARRPLLWFHAVSLGEGLAVIPLITHCLSIDVLEQQQRKSQPPFTILMTTTTASAFEVIDAQLPDGVIHQFAPVDTPAAVARFINHWNPAAIFLMESELWPNLIFFAAARGIALALLNARMSEKSFKLWSGPIVRPLITLMLSKLSLIAAVSTAEAIRFQLLQAPPFIINFAGNLKYASGGFQVLGRENRKQKDLHLQLIDRSVWMASSIHYGEEGVMLWIHKELMKKYPNLVTIIVPRHPQLGREIAKALSRAGCDVLLRSKSEKISPSTKLYIVDTLGELNYLYGVTPIAVIGGSFLPNLTGHNISEAAARGCAVLTGPYVGHFSHMISEMLQLEPLSVSQVCGRSELLKNITELLGDDESLNARRMAAKRAFEAISGGVVRRVWSLISTYIFDREGHLN